MFGIMGLSAAFMQSASHINRGIKGNYISFGIGAANPTLIISCTGSIVVQSIYNGTKITETYSDLNEAVLAIQADANTDVVIIGDVTEFNNFKQYPRYYDFKSLDVTHCLTLSILGVISCAGLTSLDVSANTALTSLNCSGCSGITALDLSACTELTSLNCEQTNITALDLSANTKLTSLSVRQTNITTLDLSACTALTSLNCNNCHDLTTLDLSNNAALTSLSCSGCTGLTEIKYPATNEDVSIYIADAITNATAADGTVYTDSAADYYSTIADAATAKGWTISQL